MVVLNNSDELRIFSYFVNRLHWSDLVEGQINTTNINKLSWSNNDGLSSDNREFGIWRNLVGKTL